MLPRPLRAALALALGLAAPAAGQSPGLAFSRPPDGLLDRPELQAVVDAQVERNGARLVAFLADGDPAVRARAAFALASVQDTAAVPALLAALADPDGRARADAAFALGQTADSTASAPLLAALDQETVPDVAARLLEALGKVGDAASLARVAEREAGPASSADLALSLARYGLRGLHHDRAVGRLVALLADPDADAEARAAAAYYYGRVRDPAPWIGVADTLRALLDGLAEDGIPAVVAPAVPSTIAHLVAAIGNLADPRDDERLVRRLRADGDWRVRVNAARALAARSAGPVLEALLAALDDPSTHVAVEAATALSAADTLPLETQQAIAHRFVRQPEPWQVSAALAPAIVRHGGAGVVMLRLTGLAGESGRNPAERAKLIAALGLDDGEPGFKLLAYEAAARDARAAAAAVTALGERFRRGTIGGEATVERYHEIFAAALRRRDLATASAAAPFLADSLLRPLGGTDVLAEVYGEMTAPADIEPMVEILNALGASADPAARAVLEEARRDPHPVLRRAATAGLISLTGQEIPLPEVGPPPTAHRVDWSFLQIAGPRPRLILVTTRGRIALQLDVEQAPLTANTVLHLSDLGYDGAPFHRVVPNFVIQGGDFERGDGYGGSGDPIRSEFTRIPFERGTIGMASAGKDSEGSQYFVTHSMQPHLDGRYTAFGRVVDGFDVLDRTLEGDRVEDAYFEHTAGATVPEVGGR